MTPERWRRIEALFAGAMELSGSARDSFLAGACAGDADLRAEVASLIESAPSAAARLQGIVSSLAESLTADAAVTHVGERVGPYRLIEVLGAGGMGTVYLAERDDDQFRRKVAIKVLHAWLASPEIVARFRDERQILATLDHPSIVRLLDGGTTPDGLPYYVMEHVEGEPCSTYARTRPIRARVELVLRICQALQYSHQKLIVHRDIKPSNILVGPDGAPKLLDFGIAKLLDPPAAGRQSLTRTGMQLLTPEYASPEQARGEAVSVATDVYSLGAVLYELLAGRPPLRPGDDAFETLKQICEVEPPRPSTVTPADLGRELGGDLDSIVLKALQKRPVQRYGSIADLAADLSGYLSGRPVSAREGTLRYRARKFVGRNRSALAIAALVVSALSTSTVVSVAQARRAGRERRTLLFEQARQEVLLGHAGRALPYLAELLRAGNDTAAIRFLLAEATRPLSRELVPPIRDPTRGITGIAWSPVGDRFAATDRGGTIRVYDTNGRLLFMIHDQMDDRGHPIFSPNGSLLTTAVAGDPPRVWNAETGALLFPLGREQGSTGVPVDSASAVVMGFDTSGRWLMSATADGKVYVWDPVAGSRVAWMQAGTRDDRPIRGVFSPSGRQVFVGLTHGAIRVFDTSSGIQAAELPGDGIAIRELRVAPDGTRLYSLSDNGAVRTWETVKYTQVAALTTRYGLRYGQAGFLDLTRDGTKLLYAGPDGAPLVADTSTGKILVPLIGEGSSSPFGFAHFSPDGQRIVTGAGSENVRLWDVDSSLADAVIEIAPAGGDAFRSRAGGVLDAQFSPDGTRLLTASANELQLWRTGREPLLAEALEDRTDQVLTASFSPDERKVISAGTGVAEIWDLASGQRTQIDFHGKKLWGSDWSPDGRRFLLVGEDAFARIYNASDPSSFVSLDGHKRIVNRGAFGPDGARVLTACDDGTARIWDAMTGRLLVMLAGHNDRVMSAAWSPDGKRVATAGGGIDRMLRVWDAATGRLLRMLHGDASPFLDVSFSHDGGRLVSSSRNAQAQIWDLASGLRLFTLEGHTGPVATARFSPDGALVATASSDRTTCIWDAATGKLLGKRSHLEETLEVAFSRDGSRILTASMDRVRVWDVGRDARPTPDVVRFVEEHAPWRLVDGRLELVVRGFARTR